MGAVELVPDDIGGHPGIEIDRAALPLAQGSADGRRRGGGHRCRRLPDSTARRLQQLLGSSRLGPAQLRVGRHRVDARPLQHKQMTQPGQRLGFVPRGQAHRRIVNRIDQTELEDEAVVESVQLGIRSRFYRQGRFSPTMEKCVHHFHQLVGRFME